MYTAKENRAKEMLASADAKMSSNDATPEAIKLVPIPELKEDLSNFDHWLHAVGFHLEFYGLDDLVPNMKSEYREGPLPAHFKTAADWHRWHRHCLHAYSIIYSQATKVIEQGSMFLTGFNAQPNYCPHKLLMMIKKYKESKIRFTA